MSKPMPSLPQGYRVVTVTTPGGRTRYQATKDGGSWVGPARKSERSAIVDARKEAGLC